MARRKRISVGKRLALLVLAEVVSAVLLLAFGVGALGGVRADLYFVRRYILPPVAGVGRAFAHVADIDEALDDELQAGTRDTSRIALQLEHVERIISKYEKEWAVADGPGHDAARFREELDDAGQSNLATVERQRITELRRDFDDMRHTPVEHVTRQQISSLHRGLVALLDVNVAYVDVAYDGLIAREESTRRRLYLIGGLAIFLSGLAALSVTRAIAPRIRRLERRVRKFQRSGRYEPSPDEGNDDIAVLASAIDAGFGAIAARDRERERFLAVAAHELKTPVTSILGFSQAALARPADGRLGRHAIEVVARNASRLKRLVDELMLAARARSDELPFRPEPVDMVALVRRVAAEVESSSPGRNVRIEGPLRAPALVDPALAAHAIWTLLAYVTSGGGQPVPTHVIITRDVARVEVAVGLSGPMPSKEDIERAVSPFAKIGYEGTPGVRAAIGLYVAREIATLHGGDLQFVDAAEHGSAVVLSVPA